MPTGTVKWFDPDKGFGFIARDDGGPDLFVHRSALGMQTLGEGDRVDFVAGSGMKGPAATNINILERNPDPKPGARVAAVVGMAAATAAVAICTAHSSSVDVARPPADDRRCQALRLGQGLRLHHAR